jgi:hypothetical protein
MWARGAGAAPDRTICANVVGGMDGMGGMGGGAGAAGAT